MRTGAAGWQPRVMLWAAMTNEEQRDLEATLARLRQEHRDLDAASELGDVVSRIERLRRIAGTHAIADVQVFDQVGRKIDNFTIL